MTNIELFELISKQYITNKEIKLITGIGINQANQLRHRIEEKYCSDMLLPPKKIPTEFLLKELGIKIEKVFEKARMESELNER